ncbi:MAG: hypothetical protein K2X35_21595 [Bryobacteraceae bacterium]|nr:hypothetical protein [Bryobacteraceae bacterium]
MLDQAGQWFVSSGITAAGGGVARFHRIDAGQNLPVSHEITGYAVSSLADLARRTGQPRFREAAIRSARYLREKAWDESASAFPFESGGPAYFFDTGIIIRGLLQAWRLSGETAFRDRAVEAGMSLAMDFLGEGFFYPVISLPEKQPEALGDRWSRQPGCYQLKSAMAWHDLAAATGDSQWNQAYERALELHLAGWREFLPGDPDPLRVMDRLHAFCYFLEGLLPACGRDEVRSVLAEGMALVTNHHREIRARFERSDVAAQLLRVRLLADARGAVPLDRARAEEEAAIVAEYQFRDGETRVRGGFCFGSRDGRRMPFVNPVSTAFCAQALAMWESGAGELADLV